MKTFKKSAIIAGVLSLAAMAAVARQEKVLQIFSNGEVIKEYPISEIDYIEVNDLIAAPSGMKADVSDDKITITWNEVAGATYNVYRSPDNVNFSLLASGLTETTYTDEAPLGGANYYKVKAVVDGVESGYSSTATGTLTEDGQQSGIYLGITGFNQALYTYPVMRLTESSVVGFRDFVDNLTMKDGTLLYYSVDQAINALQSATLPPDISTAAIVTFSKGFDQGSLMMGTQYSDDMEYLSALGKRISNEKIAGQPITSYFGCVIPSDNRDIINYNLGTLASAPAQKHVFGGLEMSEVKVSLKNIAEKLAKSSYDQTIKLKMPGLSNGTKVRFTFDKVKEAVNSELYVEGTFNLKTRSLENVIYRGMTSTSGTTIAGAVDGIFVSFTIEGVHTDEYNFIEGESTDEWTYITSSNTWQCNSEFDHTQNVEVITEHHSAVIMFALDCSTALPYDFTTAKTFAKDFISTLYDTSVLLDNYGTNIPYDEIYSTTPIDLSLAVWKDGKRYYLTKNDYDKANLSGAVIEGLTIVNGSESFVMALNEVQPTSLVQVDITRFIYGNILPTELQAKIIEARWVAINEALQLFHGKELDSYLCTAITEYVVEDGKSYFSNCIGGGSGGLGPSENEFLVRGVLPTDYGSEIHWTDPNDLKLSVIIDGKREFLTKEEYDTRKSIITQVEGLAVIAGEEKFAIQLEDAQPGGLSDVATAQALYGDILPTELQGRIMSAKLNEINNALKHFGGTSLMARNFYCTQITKLVDDVLFSGVIYSPGGQLYITNAGAYFRVRGVVNLKDEAPTE